MRGKRARGQDTADQPSSKRTKDQTSSRTTSKKATKAREPPDAPVINQPPTKHLRVFPFGNGEGGELGLGPGVTETNTPLPNKVLDAFQVVQLDCGGMHTVALTAHNQILTWGVNDNGALGRDTAWDGEDMRDIDDDASDVSCDLNPHESTPTEISAGCFPAGTRFSQVAAGDSCSFALTDTGLVYGWGTFRDSEGKQHFSLDANGKVVAQQPTPTLISGLANITQITCGANHALALDAAGNIWAWGAGEQNQLGRRVLARHVLQTLTPRRVGICRNNAKYIASGEYHSFAVDHKDDVWAWGLNSFGEAGYAEAAGSDAVLVPHPRKIRHLCGNGIVSLDGGAHHSVAVTAAGDCLAWGRMDCGQLGIDFSPEQLADESLIRHDQRNKPRICLQPTAVPNIGKVARATCGTDHSLFINKDGKAFASGFGSQGQLGLGSDDDAEVAQLVRNKHIKGEFLTWAGAGGQFSMIAASTESQP